MTKEDVKRGNADYLDLTTLKAIRAKCLDCCCGSFNEVKACPCDGVNGELCPLYQYRLGRNPNRRGRSYTEEERQAIADRLSQYRKNKGGVKPTEWENDFDDESDETTPPEDSDENFLDSDKKETIYGDEDQ